MIAPQRARKCAIEDGQWKGDDTDMSDEKFVRALAEWRGVRSMTQMDLAVKAGVSLSTVVNTEACRQDVSISTARKLAEALGVSLDAIAWPDDEALRARRPKGSAVA